MRLTLRTLLAYLDGTLESAERDELYLKLQESPMACALAQRIGALLQHRGTVPAEIDLEGGIDPNLLAEYLENTLPPHLVLDVEQRCLASEQQLAEVAECHSLLSRFAGNPADVPPGLRETLEQLPARAAIDKAKKAKERDDWYCQSASLDAGPHTFEGLRELARRGDLRPDDLVRLGEQGPWRRAGSLGRLMVLMPYQTPSIRSSDGPAGHNDAAALAGESHILKSPPADSAPRRHSPANALPQTIPVSVPRPQPARKPQFDAGRFIALGKITGLTGLAALGLLFFGWDYVGWIFRIEGQGKFHEPYHELRQIYADVEEELKSNPAPASWSEFCRETRLRMNSLERGVRALHSGLEVNSRLINAITELKAAMETGRPQDAATRLQQAEQNLDSAAKILRL
jgi:hypothetical protein